MERPSRKLGFYGVRLGGRCLGFFLGCVCVF